MRKHSITSEQYPDPFDPRNWQDKPAKDPVEQADRNDKGSWHFVTGNGSLDEPGDMVHAVFFPGGDPMLVPDEQEVKEILNNSEVWKWTPLVGWRRDGNVNTSPELDALKFTDDEYDDTDPDLMDVDQSLFSTDSNDAAMDFFEDRDRDWET